MLPLFGAADLVYNAFGVAAAAAIVAGVRLNRPAQALPWLLLAASVLIQWGADVAWSFVAADGAAVTSAADVLYLFSYVPMMAALALFIGPRRRWSEATVLLDPWVVAFGLGFVAWIVLIEPATRQPGLTLVDVLVIAGYPVLDLAMLAMAGQILLDRRRWNTSVALLVGAVLLTLAADSIYVSDAFAGTYRLGGLTDLMWLAMYTLLGAAALHPSMVAIRGTPAIREGLPRVLLLGTFAVVPLVTVLAVRDTTRRDVEGALVTSAILFVLIAVRLWGTISRLQSEMRARRSAEDERDRLTMAIEQSSEGVFVLEREHRLAYANPAFRRLSRVQAGHGPARPVPGGPAAALPGLGPELLAAIDAGEGWAGTVEIAAPDGTTSSIEIVASPLFDEAHRTVGCVGVARDVTRQKMLERQLKQAERLESLGRLAGGVAHDFNNLLTAIRGFAEMLVEELGQDDPRAADVLEIQAAADRGSRLTRQLLVFSRGPAEAPAEPLDVNQVVAEMVPLLGRILGEDVRISVAAAPDLPSVMAERGQFEQVLLNLASNARDAMPSGGSLAIETALLAAAPDSPGPLRPGVTLAVSDTGSGMDVETRRRVFDPFFTTKPVGKGTGLGLSTVYAIVRKLGGSIEIDSGIGRGTTILVHLPGAAGALPAGPAPAEQELPHGSETILLVEDQDAVREFIRRALERLGYRVLAFPGPDLALRAIHDVPGVALLFTDVIMPGMSGPELASRVAALRPDLAVLFASGHAPVETFERAGFPADTPYLAKPFTLDQLAFGIREALDRTASGPVAEQVALGL